MKKKVWVSTPPFFIISAVMLLMAAASWFWNVTVFYVEMLVAGVSALLVGANTVRFKAYVRSVIKSAEGTVKGTDRQSLEKFAASVVITGTAGDIVWANSSFIEKVCGGKDYSGETVSQFTSGKSVEQLIGHEKTDVVYNGKQYTVFSVSAEKAVIFYFVEDTYYKETALEYNQSRPSVALILFDNREELARDSSDGQDSQITAQVEGALQKWAAKSNSLFKKQSDGRYLMIVEERYMKTFIAQKFEILDEIRNIKADDRRYATISIGVGRGGKNLKECECWARKALEMALGRGGDQVAVKQGDTYEFFGGVSKGVEKRDKVRTRVIAETLSNQIKNSDSIFIMGHRFSDLDCVGAAIGMWSAVSKALNKPAYVVLNRGQSLAAPLIESMQNSGAQDIFISPDCAAGMVTDHSLLIIVDTHSRNFLESASLYDGCKRVVVIDHHRMMVNHLEGSLIFYHEPYASSASEMVTELVQYLGDNALNRLEAEALLAGIMLDTKGFVLKTGVRTFEAAAYLRRKGADTVEVKRMFSNSIDTYKAKYQLVSGAEIYNNCAIACAEEDCPDIRLASAQAADELLDIQGVSASFVLYPTSNVINISARSLGAVNVQLVMEALGGGGHQTMAGAQLESVTMEEARERLINVINTVQIHK